MGTLLIIHLAATLFMTGLIWWVQIVHYPLFGLIPEDSFAVYEREHIRMAGWVVTVPMLAELFTGLGLLASAEVRASWEFWAGLGLLTIIWLTTGFVQVRQHRRLSHGFDAATHRALLRGNWIRTAAWSLRSLLILGLAAPEVAGHAWLVTS